MENYSSQTQQQCFKTAVISLLCQENIAQISRNDADLLSFGKIKIVVKIFEHRKWATWLETYTVNFSPCYLLYFLQDI